MSFKKFSIVDESINTGESNILLNLGHIISIKPIKMTSKGHKVIDGFWLRLSNGKKYKATRIPSEIKAIFNDSLPNASINEELLHDLNIQ